MVSKGSVAHPRVPKGLQQRVYKHQKARSQFVKVVKIQTFEFQQII
jgi:hypothetical protein